MAVYHKFLSLTDYPSITPRVCTETRNLFREISVGYGKFREISLKFRSVSKTTEIAEIDRNFGEMSASETSEITRKV